MRELELDSSIKVLNSFGGRLEITLSIDIITLLCVE